jgi:hypothetical protein
MKGYRPQVNSDRTPLAPFRGYRRLLRLSRRQRHLSEN